MCQFFSHTVTIQLYRLSIYIYLQTETGEAIPVHKVVLSMHSDFFKAMFTSGLQEAQVSNPSIKLTEHPADIVKGILKFMYTGCLPGILEFKIFLEFKLGSYRINTALRYHK